MRTARGLISAAFLTSAGVLLALLCFRVAIIEALPASSLSIAQFASHDPDVVLDNAAAALVTQHGILDATTLNAVRHAAAAAPLDARAFLILGHQQLLDGEPRRAVATLEAGQQLDPRQRIIHLLLLDRYLRSGRYTDAAGQFSVSARLTGAADNVITGAMAQMSMDLGMHDAVRRTLRTDPELERQVLVVLAKSNATPAAIFALATPVAIRHAGEPDGWGPALVDRLIGQGRYDEARSVWRHIYSFSPAQTDGPLFDADFQKRPGSPPFNWTLTANSLGAADIRDGALAVDYYGRDTGVLVEQLLVLKPGSYRFGFTVDGNKAAAGTMLAWTLRCASNGKDELMNAVVSASGARRSEIARFVVPAGCPAQALALIGNAGEFPAPVNVTIRNLVLQSVTEHP